MGAGPHDAFIALLTILLGGACLYWQVRRNPLLLRAFDERPRSTQIVTWLAGCLIWVGVWYGLAAQRPTGPTQVPSPIEVLVAAGRLIQSGELYEALLKSLSRIAIGFSAAALVGTTVGWLSGTFALAYGLTTGTNSFIRYIPPTAFVTLLIVYLGVGESYKYSVVFLSVIAFIIQMTIDAVEDIDQRYWEMARLSRLTAGRTMKHVVVPATLPRVVDILRINLSGAWTFLVAAEVVGAKGGLGYLISQSHRFGRIDELYVGIAVFGVIGVLSDYLIQKASTAVFRW